MSRKHHIQQIDTAELLEQAMALGQTVGDAAVEASKAAAQYAGQGVDWATPHVERAWRESVKAAAPKIEAAAEVVKPAIDTAHDKLVDEFIPMLVAAANAAAQAAADAEGSISERVNAVVEATGAAVAPKSHHLRNTMGWVLVGSAVAGTGYLLWKRTQPIDDPWAEEYWDDAAASAPTADEAAEAVEDAVEDVSDAAADAAETVTEAVSEAVEEAADVVEDATDA